MRGVFYRAEVPRDPSIAAPCFLPNYHPTKLFHKLDSAMNISGVRCSHARWRGIVRSSSSFSTDFWRTVVCLLAVYSVGVARLQASSWQSTQRPRKGL
eukprot:scaffold93610_cov25-Tisochrysis_lutea.AAC.3